MKTIETKINKATGKLLGNAYKALVTAQGLMEQALEDADTNGLTVENQNDLREYVDSIDQITSTEFGDFNY